MHSLRALGELREIIITLLLVPRLSPRVLSPVRTSHRDVSHPRLVLEIPIDGFLHAFFEVDLRLPVDQVSRLFDIGPGVHHVGVVEGFLVDDRLLPQESFKGLNHPIDRNRILSTA